MKISVIIPVYNVAEYLTDTLECLKKQNLKDIEYLIINDGSNDNTLEIATRYSNDDSRFIVHSKENGGVSSARNVGLTIARGDFILFLDGDDLLGDETLSNLYDKAITTGADIVYGRQPKLISGQTSYLKSHVNSNLYTDDGIKNIIDNPELFLYMSSTNKLYKKTLIKDARFPTNISYAEDQVFAFKLWAQSNSVVFLNEDTYFYREREGEQLSAMQQIDKKGSEYLIDIITVVEELFCTYPDSLKLSDEELLKVYTAYLTRLMQYDIYPLFISGLKRNPSSSLNSIKKIINLLDSNLISRVPVIRYYFFIDLANKEYLIPRKYHTQYANFLNILLSKHSDSSINAFKNKYPYEFKHLNDNINGLNFIQFLRNKIKKIIIVNKSTFKKNIYTYYFNFCKLMPINKKQVLFVKTQNVEKINNFTSLENSLKAITPDLKIKYLTSPRLTLRNELSKLRELARAKVIIADDYYNTLYDLKIRKDTLYLQIWHGGGALKKFAHSAIGSFDANSFEFEKKAHEQYSYAFCTSEEIVPHFAKSFGIPEEKVLPLGIPRIDSILEKNSLINSKKLLNKKYPMTKNKRIIFYAPTYRGNAAVRSTFTHTINWSKLDLPANSVIIIKYHGCVKNVTNPPKHPNIIVINDISVNHLLNASDVLISDFSSIIFEYALLNKPIIHHLENVSTYNAERGFFFDLNDYLFGYEAYSDDDLKYLLNTNLSINPTKQNKFLKQFMSSCDGRSSDKIAEFIKSEI